MKLKHQTKDLGSIYLIAGFMVKGHIILGNDTITLPSIRQGNDE